MVWAWVCGRGAREAFVLHIKAAIKGFQQSYMIRSVLCRHDSLSHAVAARWERRS